jgi:hypothetical protein
LVLEEASDVSEALTHLLSPLIPGDRRAFKNVSRKLPENDILSSDVCQ